MYKKTFFTKTALFLILSLSLGLSSCNKGCDVQETDTVLGLIEEDGIVYASSGGMTGSMAGVYHITSGHNYASNFEMSFNGGQSRAPINYSQYSILCSPMIVNCEVAFIREVTRNDVAMTATYSVTAYQCKTPKCADKRTVENYVLVPAIPSSYTIIYNINIVET